MLTASTPSKAIRIAKARAGEIKLVATDVIMPEMNGLEFSKVLREIMPEANFFPSGYTANVIVHRGVLDSGLNFLQKPFSMDALSVKTCEVLEVEG